MLKSWCAYKQLILSTEKISNPDFALNKALELSTELNTVWTSSDVKKKERLQKLVFPEGVVYDRKNNTFRTPKVNVIFELIAGLQRITEENKKGQTDDFHRLSLLAGTDYQLSNQFNADLEEIIHFK